MKEFEGVMVEMNHLSSNAHSWLKGKDPSQLSKSHFIMDAKDKPILTMLETIITKVMRRIVKKKEAAEKFIWPLCPKILQKLDLMIKYSNRWVSKYCFLFFFIFTYVH